MNQSKETIGKNKYTTKGYAIAVMILVISFCFSSINLNASEINNYIEVEGNNYQGNTKWSYEYTGNSEKFIVPVSGEYQFEVYGAQGANYGSYNGGYGGSVIGTIELTEGDEINITVGATNGYNGGGNGLLSTGGGASNIEKNGKLVVLAGGGGGATDFTDGNAGGSTSGMNGIFLNGSDSVEENSAGGGAGYEGGYSGYTKYHSHNGNSTEGGMCYNTPVYHTHLGNESEGGGCYSIPTYHEHIGESAYYGGCYTDIIYHEHQGNSTEQGGCYMVPVYHSHVGNKIDGGACYGNTVMHEHTSTCSTTVCTGTSFTAKELATVNGLQTAYYCDSCGMGYTELKSVCESKVLTCSKGGTVEYYELSCTKSETTVENYNIGCGMLTTTPESYALSCEKTEEEIESYNLGCNQDLTTIIEYALSCNKIENETIDEYKAASGGSNYCDTTVCFNIKSNAGANAGDGRIVLTLVSVDGATISYYSDTSSLLGKVTVVKGETIIYPLQDNPTKKADERYSYNFIGWDDLGTEVVELYSNQETIKNTEISHNYIAVYDIIGKSYVISFDNQGADAAGTYEMNAIYGQSMSNIEIPIKNNYIFAGYYSQPQGVGKQYYNSAGIAVSYSDITANTVLYAHWIQPICVTEQPTDICVAFGYRGVGFDFKTQLTEIGDFSVEYQWYQKAYKDADSATPIEGAIWEEMIFPEGHSVGEYFFLCKISVKDNTNQHTYSLFTNTVTVQIVKGELTDKQVSCKENERIYDGKYHSVVINADVEEYNIYYAQEELNVDNYISTGKEQPISLINSGNYKIYYYITSTEYEDYAGKIDFTIHKAQPKIVIKGKNVSYTGESLYIDASTVIGVYDEILQNAEVTYTYYVDEKCTIETTKEEGATVSGGAPSKIGTYYVTAHVNETINYTAVSTISPVLLNILETTLDFEICGYSGTYDGSEHGIMEDKKGNKNISFYYSTDTMLTAQNYLINGKTVSPTFKNAGSYKVYYLIVNKLLGNLNSYIPGNITVTIYKAHQFITDQNRPYLNTSTNKVFFPEGGEWEYKTADSFDNWKKYMGERMSEGIYEFRLQENENYCASESVIIQVYSAFNDKENSDKDTSDDEQISSNPDMESETPSIDIESSKNPVHNEEETAEKEISIDKNNNRIPDIYEQDENRNGIPDIYEADNNSNGIPDYYEWDTNANGIADYLEDENQNGIPDFLELQKIQKYPVYDEKEIIEIKETSIPLDENLKQTLAARIVQAVTNIISEENVKIAVPCVTAGMIIGIIASYLILILLIPFIKSKTKYCYYIETKLSAKKQKYEVRLNTDYADIESTSAVGGVHIFEHLCQNEDYILTIKDHNNYSVGIVRLTFVKKRVFHEIIINRETEIRVEQLKHGARVHIR